MVDGLKAILDFSLDDEALFDQEQFEPEAFFKAFALARDFSLDSAAVEQLVDLVFRGNSCMIEGYDATVVRKLVKAWLVDLNTRGIEQAAIVDLQAQLINVAADRSESDLRMNLKESDLCVNAVVMRRDPNLDQVKAVFGGNS